MNICEVFGAAGYIRTNYTYSPFGEVTASGDVTQPLQWSSEFFDTELSLVYYNFRYFAAHSGSWLTQDIIREKHTPNLYLYNFNNPISSIDMLGLKIYKKMPGYAKNESVTECLCAHKCTRKDGRHYHCYCIPQGANTYSRFMSGYECLAEADYRTDNTEKAKTFKRNWCCTGFKNGDTYPQPQPQRVEDEVEEAEYEIDADKVITATATTAAVVTAGYVTYRVIRMIPSPFPPLWWTIPGNIAIP